MGYVDSRGRSFICILSSPLLVIILLTGLQQTVLVEEKCQAAVGGELSDIAIFYTAI